MLAQLALARVPGLVVHERPKHAPADFPYDFLVAAEHGACFFVAVNAFASFRMSKRGDIRDADELHWALDADLVRRAETSRSPFILFLFDADTEHGRDFAWTPFRIRGVRPSSSRFGSRERTPSQPRT